MAVGGHARGALQVQHVVGAGHRAHPRGHVAVRRVAGHGGQQLHGGGADQPEDRVGVHGLAQRQVLGELPGQHQAGQLGQVVGVAFQPRARVAQVHHEVGGDVAALVELKSAHRGAALLFVDLLGAQPVQIVLHVVARELQHPALGQVQHADPLPQGRVLGLKRVEVLGDVSARVAPGDELGAGGFERGVEGGGGVGGVGG